MLRRVAGHLREQQRAPAAAPAASTVDPSYWAAAAQRQSQLPLLDLANCAFDYDDFLRDGVAVLPGVLTPVQQCKRGFDEPHFVLCVCFFYNF